MGQGPTTTGAHGDDAHGPSLEISIALRPTAQSHKHIALAEELGYSRAWLFDGPHNSRDVWHTLSKAAERTSRIGLGPGVLVPSLRHPIVNASQTAALASVAPGRVSVAFGTGFVSRAALGQPPIHWSYMRKYIKAYRDLLAGKATEWDGALVKLMSDADGLDIELPIQVPLYISALGPRGDQFAKELHADGIFGIGQPTANMPDYQRAALLVWGTVLDPGELTTDPRVERAAGPAWAVAYHFSNALGGADAVKGYPGGPEWLKVIEAVDVRERHLAVHDGHLARMNLADEAAWQAGGHQILEQVTISGTPDKVREHVGQFAAAGVTEIVYQPIGPDIEREMLILKTVLDNAS